MKTVELQNIWSRMEREISELQQSTDAIKEKLINSAAIFTTVLQDGLDHAQQATDLCTTLELGARDLRRMSELKMALLKMARREFGWCENCEEEIPVKRLEVHPTAYLCRSCQHVRERVTAAVAHPCSSYRSPAPPEIWRQSATTLHWHTKEVA